MAPDCQSHCKEWKSQGCVAFVYEEVPKTCTLYNNIKHIEYDEDKDKKVMGYVDGCLSALCHRPGWDYDKDSPSFFYSLFSLVSLKKFEQVVVPTYKEMAILSRFIVFAPVVAFAALLPIANLFPIIERRKDAT